MRNSSGRVLSRKYLSRGVGGSGSCCEATMSDMDTTADRPWTLEAVQQLTELVRQGVPVPVISLKLKRSIASIHAKLTELGLTVPASA